MTKTSVALLTTLLSCVAAYPGVANLDVLLKRTEPAARDPLFLITRPNTGLPPSGFNAADQYVDTTDGGPHRFIAPSGGDAIEGLGQAYNMAPDLAAFLGIVAVGLSGDPLTETWSIGPPFKPSLPIFPARGILGTHNKYEGDASIVRGDAYLHNGSPGIFQMRQFESAYNFAKKYDNNFGHAASAALLAGLQHTLVDCKQPVSAAECAENPGGELPTDILKSFFSVTGEPGSFVYTRGHERIPVNWYRRATLDAHNIPECRSSQEEVDCSGNSLRDPWEDVVLTWTYGI
ncbi:uncharacterized protein RCC_01140 [Ramularia collo-cygni]|uniref:Heme haloperoxidase family profile domain-containing protein n=1 Tax=Ramularia collo-cygni TaxID=112498 RepID=A0A2D3UW52_9PEZI|nr:uncharacterized protein RCC_01140 [Ramularia collo-cygni]CZT15276.1 uncharacterized protein RCC_01140 [Ramularia collo-cygni]